MINLSDDRVNLIVDSIDYNNDNIMVRVNVMVDTFPEEGQYITILLLIYNNIND